MKILMVCLGNICRSPLAEGILKSESQKAGFQWEIDSAGTGGWHAGEAPDKRSIEVARKYGIDISKLRARQFRIEDLDHFDRIYVMDADNYSQVIRKAKSDSHRLKIQYLLQDQSEVPDPWYDNSLFEPVYHMITEACQKIVKEVKSSMHV